jgi:glycosyltransferase involved in cell wall biosynthesis
MEKLDLTTIILTYNEELHIRRCLENVCPISKKVYVIDSPSTDRTVEICNEFPNVEVVVHKYPGNQAAQFNWAVDNIKIDTEWVLRLDADEYLLPELINELREKLPFMGKDVAGIEFKRRHIFMGRWMKHGIYPVIMLRMFRNGCGRYDNRLMDEHMILTKGRSVVFENDFCDHSLISLSDYCRKHINYAQREAVEVLNEKWMLTDSVENENGHGAQTLEKHKKKGTYNKMPLFWRSFAYFLYRYIVKGGFLDGKEGFLFAYIQGWWYRTLVDANVMAAEKVCGDDKDKIKNYIKVNYGIEL